MHQGKGFVPERADSQSAPPTAGVGAPLGPTSGQRSAMHDYGKMLAVGAVGFVLDFGLFNALATVGWPAAWANLVALVVAGLATFKGNLSLTFGHRNIPDRRAALVRFCVVTLASIVVIEAVVAVAAAVHPDLLVLNAVKAAVTAVAVGGRFFLYREWVFRHVPA